MGRGFYRIRSLNIIKGQEPAIIRQNTMHLGIDVSKYTLDCCLISDGIFYERKFANDSGGIDKLQIWLHEHGADHTLHCCCEATGTYYETVAVALSG